MQRRETASQLGLGPSHVHAEAVVAVVDVEVVIGSPLQSEHVELQVGLTESWACGYAVEERHVKASTDRIVRVTQA
jgi:hypothetical protein